MQDGLTDLFQNWELAISFEDALIAIGFSLVAAIITYLMYQVFYGSRNIGAGVHRTFIIGGPAITALFLGIQTSIPLGLGLLGALSFVRFRTPVKDPAEIGFLLLLIASSVGAATGGFLITTVLFVVVFGTLGIQWLARRRLSFFAQGHLMLTLGQDAYDSIESRLDSFLVDRLRGLRLETMSVLDDRVSLNYQYRTKRGFDWTGFTGELRRLVAPAKMEIFIG